MNYKKTLIEANKELFKKRKKQVSYLSLSGKPELFLRDTLAFLLQKKLEKDFLVGREWNRYDISIFRNEEKAPDAVIEMKVFYNFDAIDKKLEEFRNSIKRDVKKMSDIQSEHFFVLFIIHPQSIVGELYRHIFSYINGVNALYKKFDSHTLVRKEYEKNIDSFAENEKLEKLFYGYNILGEYCDTKVGLSVWVWKY